AIAILPHDSRETWEQAYGHLRRLEEVAPSTSGPSLGPPPVGSEEGNKSLGKIVAREPERLGEDRGIPGHDHHAVAGHPPHLGEARPAVRPMVAGQDRHRSVDPRRDARSARP